MLGIDDLLRDSDAETTFLILCCRVYLGTSNDADLPDFLANHVADFDDDRFYQLVKTHRVRPVVFKALANCKIFNGEKLIEKLGADCRIISLLALNHLKEMFRVISVLQSKGICVLPYRGPIFSKMYYGDWAMRESSDLDFLIDKKHIQELNFLKHEGYKAKHVFNDYRDIDIHQNSQSIDLNNDDGNKRNIHLEFHYNIVAACYGIDSGYEDAQQNNGKFSGGGQTIDVLSHEATTGIVLAHHGLQDIWMSLKYYLDLASLCNGKEQMNWDKVKSFTQKHGFHKLSAAAFHNMELLLGIKNPMKDSPDPGVYSKKLLELCLSPDKFANRGFYKLNLRLQGRDSLIWKVKMIWGLFTLFLRPTTEDFEWKYFPPSLFWLYYICKPPRLVYTYLVQPIFGKKAVFPFR